MFRVLFLLVFSFSARANEFVLSFEEESFKGHFERKTYIQNGSYVHIDDQFINAEPIGRDDISKRYEMLPRVFTRSLSDFELQQIALALESLGVDDWNSAYPEDSSDLICDGKTFELYIKTSEFEVFSRGACEFPDNYEKVVNFLRSIHETPNKPINTLALLTGTPNCCDFAILATSIRPLSGRYTYNNG